MSSEIDERGREAAAAIRRWRAAIGTLEHLATELQAIRHRDHPTGVTMRIREISRLMDEAADLLRRQLAAVTGEA